MTFRAVRAWIFARRHWRQLHFSFPLSQKMSDSSETKAPSWVPNPSIEARKLQSKREETPWKNIAGTVSPVKSRTRGRRVVVVHPPTPESLSIPCKKSRPRKRLFAADECSGVSSLTGDDDASILGGEVDSLC